jgi:type IV pilus assembly protein PilB
MNPMDATVAAQQAGQNGSSLVSWLIKNNAAPSMDIAKAISEQHQIPMVDPTALPVNEVVKSIFSAEQIQKLQALPILKEGRNITIAIADPDSLDKIQEVQFTIDGNVNTAVVEYHAFKKLMESRLNQASNDNDMMSGDVGLSIPEENRSNAYYLDSLDLERFENDDLAITRFVDRMLEHAITQKVSDIHIEPYEETFRVRYRIDGILHVVSIPPKKSAQQLVSRLKVMSRMNISERRIPQDGNIRFEYDNGNQKMDFRVNTLPTMHGEKVVLRILDSSAAKMGIDKLGFEPEQKQTFLNALKKPDGMILVTGPTGSGKTVTLYTGLNILNRAEKNISTAEDPVEIQLPGVNQVHVNAKVGLTFAEALRAFLRQDPDIIMVGEIRDLETAEIAIKAAQTGHLVLSTLHTNSAPETLTRLINMGVPAFSIASSVNLIIAQRLARRLCSCKQPAEYAPEALLSMGFKEHELDTLKLYKPNGCELCSDGYKGRVGIYQVMPISEAMGRIVMSGGTSIDLADQAAKEGILDLRQSGLEKARQGFTSIEEVDRVTKD